MLCADFWPDLKLRHAITGDVPPRHRGLTARSLYFSNTPQVVQLSARHPSRALRLWLANQPARHPPPREEGRVVHEGNLDLLETADGAATPATSAANIATAATTTTATTASSATPAAASSAEANGDADGDLRRPASVEAEHAAPVRRL